LHIIFNLMPSGPDACQVPKIGCDPRPPRPQSATDIYHVRFVTMPLRVIKVGVEIARCANFANFRSSSEFVICCGRVSVRPSVRLSVTNRCSSKMAKPRIMLTTPYDSAGTLVFYCQIYRRNSNGVTPNGSSK